MATARRINVFDSVPAGTTIVTGSSGPLTSIEGNPATVTFSNGNFIIDSLAAADSLDLSIRLKIATDFSGTTLDNFAEIRGADDDDDATTNPPLDVDSTPDATAFNQAGESNDPTDATDNVIDQDGLASGDEDDFDGTRITIIPCPNGNCDRQFGLRPVLVPFCPPPKKAV